MNEDDLGTALIAIGGVMLVVAPLTLWTVLAHLSGVFAIMGLVVLFLGMGIAEGEN